VTLVFTPTAAGAVAANLVITGEDQTATSQLTGTGNQPRRVLSVDNATVQFPSTAVGARGGPVAVTFRNTGDLPVAVSGAVLQGSASAQFFIVANGCAAQTLAVNATCSVSVVALPSSAGTPQASLVVTGSNGESATATLNVVAFTPTVTTAPPPPTTTRPGQLSARPGTITFPTTAVGATSEPATVTLSNSGGSPVSITEVSISGGDGQFRVAADACQGVQLNVGRTCSVAVVVQPSEGGELTASLTISGSRGESADVALDVESLFAPALTVTPGVVHRGDLIRVTGAGFPTDRLVVVELATATGAGPALPLGSVTSDDAGAFQLAVVVPQNGIAGAGWRVVVADQSDFGGVAAPLLVDQRSAAPGAATGSAGIGGIPRPGGVPP
jgi:hypothetical protein